MIKSFSLLSISLLSLLLAGCTLTPSHFDGEDLLDTGHKTEMQDPVIPPAKEASDGPVVKAVSKPIVKAPQIVAAPVTKTGTEKPPVRAVVETPISPPVAPKETCVKKPGEVLPPPAPGTPVTEKKITLQKGDKVKVTVFREKDLSGEYALDDKGAIKFPLIGHIAATGLTADQLQEKLTAELSKGYLVKPEVNVEFLFDCAKK